MPQPAQAIPVFANRYGVSCEVCHTIVPRLTAFGEAFQSSGYRWPAAVATRPVFPISLKTNLAYTSAQDPDGLPKATVDEIEFLAMGPIGQHLNYRLEQYAVDGGRPGKTRDAFIEFNSDPERAWTGSVHPAFDIQAGQFTLPLPDDPETFRPTENHYAVFDQTVGENPFNLFDDRIGLNASVLLRKAQLNVLVLKGHDPQSGLQTGGVDRMIAARIGSNPLAFFAYQYNGTRPIGGTPNAFWRRGFAVTSINGRERTSLLLQTGNDSNSGEGAAVSSGGYLQEEWMFNERFIGVIRLDGTNVLDGFSRSVTFSLSFRPFNRARFTIEDVMQNSGSHTLNAAWLFAY